MNTHTYAELQVSHSAYQEIYRLLKQAGYEHAFDPDTGAIDMHGIGLVSAAEAQAVPVMGPAVAITDAGKIMQLVWAYGDAMYQHGRCRNDNDECPHYSEAQDVLAMFEPLLTNPTSITSAELSRIAQLMKNERDDEAYDALLDVIAAIAKETGK